MMGQNSSVTSEATGTTTQQASTMNALARSSPPRPPPPPYPGQYNEVAQNRDVDSSSWPPQRPNSLALGNCSKKKILNNR